METFGLNATVFCPTPKKVSFNDLDISLVMNPFFARKGVS